MKPPASVKQGIDNLMLAIAAPTIVWPGFEDSLPDLLKKDLPLQRMVQAMKGETEMATDAEAVAYLMTASLAHSMSPDWASIYLHIASRYLGKATPKEFSDKYKTLEPHQQEELDKLKRWIRRKQVEQLRARRKAAATP